MEDDDQVFPPGRSSALVVLEFPSFRDFIGAYSPIISQDGVFIRDEDVARSNAFAVGDEIEFEVRLKDDFRLIQGKGVVVRMGAEEAAGGASGAAIRFSDIDEPSQRLISRLVDNYVRDGGRLFEVGHAAPGVHDEVEPVAAEDGTQSGSELTPETLQASEAAALFAEDDETEDSSPVEVETVSARDFEVSDDEVVAPPPSVEAPEFSLDQPVGLETVAIPSGLVSIEDARQAVGAGDEPAPESVPVPSEEELSAEGSDPPPEALTPDVELEAGPAPPPLDLFAEPPLEDEGAGGELLPELPEGADAALEAADGGEESFDPVAEMEGSSLGTVEDSVLGSDEEDSSFEAAADSLEDELGAKVGIPDEIAQVAEELSGVHRYELPAPEEQSGGTYAGAASARAEPNAGGRIAGLVVIATLLGATAYYFGDTMLGWVGLGDDGSSGIESSPVSPGETMAAVLEGPEGVDADPAEPTEAPASGAASPSTEAGEPVPSDSAAPPSGEPAETLPGETSLAEPVAEEVENAAPVDESAVQPQEDLGLRTVEEIGWEQLDGATVVTIRLSREISKAYFEVVRIREGAPREVLRILGVDTPYSPSEQAVGGAHIVRLRTGLHQGADGSALHVVADVASAAVEIRSVETKGRDLVITFL